MGLMYEREMEKQSEERAKEESSANFDVVKDIQKSIGKDKELKELYENIKTSVINYTNLVESQEKRRGTEGEPLNPQETEESDLFRKTSHDALIDRLNILSRTMAEKGIEPKWRLSWGPLETLTERQAISQWAQQMASVFEKENEAQEAKQKKKRS